jgi:hypothetical protein
MYCLENRILVPFRIKDPVVGPGGPDFVGRFEIGLRDDGLVVMADVELIRFAPVGQPVLPVMGSTVKGLALKDIAFVFLVLDDAEDGRVVPFGASEFGLVAVFFKFPSQ